MCLKRSGAARAGCLWKKIEKGWSSDEKYHVRTQDGRYLQPRISAPERYAAKKKECEIIEKFSSLEFSDIRAGRVRAVRRGDVYARSRGSRATIWKRFCPRCRRKSSTVSDARRAASCAGSICCRWTRRMPEETKKERKLRQLERYEASDVRDTRRRRHHRFRAGEYRRDMDATAGIPARGFPSGKSGVPEGRFARRDRLQPLGGW